MATRSTLSLAFCLLAVAFTSAARAQDILRSRAINTNQHNANSNNLNQNSLANIQLPPQLASLSPQQLHQLAQLRELQLQQQAQQERNNRANSNAENVAPAPIGAEVLAPTAQPASGGHSGGGLSAGNFQSTRNSAASAQPAADSHERLDDGSYNESGSEMEGVVQSGGDSSDKNSGPSSSSAAASSGSAAATPTSGESANGAAPAAAAPTFEVNWNKCPQLEPSESEKNRKTQVITKCLQSAPIPSNLTRENVESHREQIATCALKVEGWFDNEGSYRYDKAEAEIRGKRLEAAIENQVLKFHVACKDEANKKFPRDQNKLIDQVQFYQACMDYYISIVCEIEVSVDQ